MSVYFRGVAWFAPYVVLVGLPAVLAAVDPIAEARGSAVEISVALGPFAYSSS